MCLINTSSTTNGQVFDFSGKAQAILHRNPNIGIEVSGPGGKVTLWGKDAAGFVTGLFEISGGWEMDNNIHETLHAQTTGQPTPLSGANLQTWKNERDRMLNLLQDKNSKCYKYLKRVGFDPNGSPSLKRV